MGCCLRFYKVVNKTKCGKSEVLLVLSGCTVCQPLCVSEKDVVSHSVLISISIRLQRAHISKGSWVAQSTPCLKWVQCALHSMRLFHLPKTFISKNNNNKKMGFWVCYIVVNHSILKADSSHADIQMIRYSKLCFLFCFVPPCIIIVL